MTWIKFLWLCLHHWGRWHRMRCVNWCLCIVNWSVVIFSCGRFVNLPYGLISHHPVWVKSVFKVYRLYDSDCLFCRYYLVFCCRGVSRSARLGSSCEEGFLAHCFCIFSANCAMLATVYNVHCNRCKKRICHILKLFYIIYTILTRLLFEFWWNF